ncbi:MAG: ketopantoate reductase family protein [Candidatus Hydrogenedentes bacterium]|nr:ketopantoate reductase family protein [Candidatus Hydrogenedentota bacterium]
MNERFVIQGIGGIGGVIAGMMRAAELRPVLVTNNEDITHAINDHGIQVSTPSEKHTTSRQAFTTLPEAAAHGLFDAAFLVMKATGVVEAAVEAARYLNPGGYVVTFQNGIVEDAVGHAIGIERVVSASIGWNAVMHAPGVYERTTPGDTFIGELDGSTSPRVRAIADALRHAGPVKISTNMRGVLWSKLAINCTINSVGALTGETLGEMLGDARIRRLFLLAYSEVVDTAEAQNVRLERIAANPKLLYLPKDAGPITRYAKDVIARMLGRKYKHARASTLQSLERGRKTEVDFLNGYVVDAARKLSIPTPVNAALTIMIKEIEGGTRKIAQSNIDDLLQMISEA